MDTVLLNGFFVGLVYGLLAVGLVVTYRCSRVINFAYGETGMLGAFVFTELWIDNKLALPLALLAGLALSAGIGAATERLVIRPLQNEPRLIAMVATLGVASLIITYASRRYGLNPRFTMPLVGGDGFRAGDLSVQPSQIIILLVSSSALTLLWLVYRYTGFGLRLRATALDPYAAGMVGVNSNTTSIAAWALAGGLAGLSAILIAPSVSFSVFFMTSLLLRSVAAALVGGLTNVGGAFTAGILLGLAEAVIGYKAPVTGIVEVTLAVGIIVLLLVRPQGLFRSAY